MLERYFLAGDLLVGVGYGVSLRLLPQFLWLVLSLLKKSQAYKLCSTWPALFVFGNISEHRSRMPLIS